HLDRHRLHDVEVFEVLLGDERDRQVHHVDLVGLAKMEQQIERALELGEGHPVRRTGRLLRHPSTCPATARSRAAIHMSLIQYAGAISTRPKPTANTRNSTTIP